MRFDELVIEFSGVYGVDFLLRTHGGRVLGYSSNCLINSQACCFYHVRNRFSSGF